MTPERWKKIGTLFEAVLEQEPAERRRFLIEACDGDSDLFDEVWDLVQADGEEVSLLEGHAMDIVEWPEALTFEGKAVGRYRVLERIGAGGMGAVYLAERADGQFEQRVALKFIKRGMDTEAIFRRFQAERQILARLEHPHIARLLDGGVTDDGTPFFAMEYVSGQPLDTYCDTHQLSIEERLNLFVTVCQAVQYAHRNLVVHRDLKPDNILVDEDGRVKLLDFGIAKVIQSDTEESALTRTGFRLMTPEYAAPEQIRGEPATTTTDVYALGVILYELLTGQRPYELADRSLLNLRQVIGTTQPVSPSAAIRRSVSQSTPDTPTAEVVSKARNTNPERLHRRITGDLDTIVMTALRKESGERYGSVQQFQEDIQRFLNGMPVTARPITIGYRVRKFVQRNRIGVGFAAAVLILVAGLIGFYTWQLAAERDRATQEAERANQVADFLRGVFQVASPSQALGESVTARELLDEGARRIQSELADQPVTQAEMMNLIGGIYEDLGLYDNAETMLDQAVDINTSVYGPAHPAVGKSLNDLAAALHRKGELVQAESLSRASLDILQAADEVEPTLLAHTLNTLGSILADGADFEAAEPYHQQALELRRQAYGDQHEEVVVSLNNLAFLKHREGKYHEADSLYRETLTLAREVLGEEHPEVITIMNNLAEALNRQGKYESADPLYRQVLALDRKVNGPRHPYVAISLNNLARNEQAMQHYQAAETLFVEAMDLRRDVLGEQHPAYAESLNNLGMLYYLTGEYDRAETWCAQALERSREILGPEHPRTAVTLNNMGLIAEKKQQYRAAEAFFREALAVKRVVLPEDHPWTARSLIGLGRMLTRQGQFEEAESLLQEGLAIHKKALPEGHEEIALAEQALGWCLMQRGHYEVAEMHLLNSYTVLQAQFGDNDERVEAGRNRLAELYTAWEKPEQARSFE